SFCASVSTFKFAALSSAEAEGETGSKKEAQQRASSAELKSDAAALRRTDAVMRNRRDVADRGDGETHRLERAQRRLTARTRALHLDLEGAHAVFHGLLAGRLRGHLRRVRGRL